jgi:ABC-2 type transport system ATP-binding protein
MKRRVNIAAGLVHQPRLLFLDEPTVGVDPQSRNQIFESVLGLNRERGMSIIYTSHYMEEVEYLCNRVAIIDEGKIIALDTVENLIAMLGGGVIQVGFHQVDDALLDQITALPSVNQANLLSLEPALIPKEDAEVEDVETEPEERLPVVKVECADSQQTLVELIEFAYQQDLKITSLKILDPNLESVFLHLTGKQLRE